MRYAPTLLGLLVSGLLATSICRADSPYSIILDPGEIVTGVRGLDDSGSNVVLTGSYLDGNGATQGLLYEGALSGGGTTYYNLTPNFTGETSSVFYGPDTPFYNPDSIAPGNVQIVGSYQTSSTGSQDHGLLYQGTPTGTGTWTNIDVPESYTGAPVGETIAHSTMGDLVVGDYDLQGNPNSANAFIYSISSQKFTLLNIGGSMSNDTTAYGIWQNGASNSTSYTIAGGSQAELSINKAFLVDYDSLTGQFTNLKYYTDPSGGFTHFEGITAVAGGFNVIGTTTTGAEMAFIPVNGDGTFGDATWTPVAYPDSGTSTGNSVYGDTGMGIFTQTGTMTQSYIVVVPEPSTNVLIILSLVGLGFIHFRRRSSTAQ